LTSHQWRVKGVKPPARIADVARRAGVSEATVSRVLNGKTSVDAKLVVRVQRAARALNYQPSHVARNLRARSSSVWGIVVSDIGNPFFTRIVRAVQDEAWRLGRTVIVCNTDEDLEKERSAVDALVAERVGGVVIAPASETETDLRPLLDRGIPVVAFDRRPPIDVDSVLVDNVAGGLDATRLLLASGIRELGCITGPDHVTTARERLDGFRTALRRAGVRVPRHAVVHANFREEGGRDALLALLDARRLPQGLFVTNNLMTLGVLRAAYERGLRVPEDLSVVGFDELPWGGGIASRVPVVAQPAREMAAAAVSALDARVRGERGPAQHVVLQARVLRLDPAPGVEAAS
jgi:LacI family transcriptional regulator